MKQRITATNCSNVSIVGRRGPRTVLLIGLLAAFVVAPVHAIPVVEVGPSMVNQLLTQINTYLAHLEAVGEYTKEAKRWDDQFKQYQQQLVKVQAQLRTVGMPDSQSLVKVPPNYMVAQTCGSDGGVIQQLTSMVSLTDDASVRAQQKQICTNIRLMKNRKYNDSVDYLSSTVPSMKKMLEEVYQVRSRSNEQGNVQCAPRMSWKPPAWNGRPGCWPTTPTSQAWKKTSGSWRGRF